MAISSSIAENEVQMPANVKLCPFNPTKSTRDLVDCWRILLRASVDAAILDPSNRNIFAFAGSCIYLASIHDKDYYKTSSAERRQHGDMLLSEEELWCTERFLEQYGAGASNMSFDAPGRTSAGLSDEDPWASDGYYTMEDMPEKRYKYPSSSSADITSDYAALEVPSIADTTDERFISDDASLKLATSSDLIGIAYLIPSSGAASVACEASLGLALLPHARGKGFGTETVRQLLAIAFDEFHFHRVSAGVLGPGVDAPRNLLPVTVPASNVNNGKSAAIPAQVESLRASGTLAETEAALRMFVAAGFTIEGVRRRAVPDLEDNGAWRDAHYLAMLDTEWVISQCRPRRTRWDEMLARHNSETEMLAKAESRLKRSASTETLRPYNGAALDIGYAPSESSTSINSQCHGASSKERSSTTNHSSASSCVSGPAVKPFSDLVDAPDRLTRRFVFSSDNRSDAEDSELDYGEVCYDAERFSSLSKVEGYLRSNPTPGPPPSEVGSNLDSDREADFESCADPDELDILENTKGKNKANRAIFEAQEPDMAEQIRKRRRLSNANDSEQSNGIATNVAVGAKSISTGSLRMPALMNASTTMRSVETDNAMDTDLEASDSEAGSTIESMSAWDIVSGGVRSSSPSPSLSSYSGSLSLQSVYISEDV